MKYKPRHDFVVVKELEQPSNKELTGGIILPNDKKSVLARLEVLAVGPEVKDINVGDIVLAEKMFIPIDPNQKGVCIIRQEWVHLIEDGK